MEAKGLFIRADDSLLPIDDRGREIIGKLNGGDKVLVHIHRARYPEHHRLAWKVFSVIGEAIGKPAEWVLSSLKVRTGRFDFIELLGGIISVHPHSIRFESMSQDEFQKFWNDCLPIIFEEFMPEIPEPVFTELRDMIAGELPQ